MRNGWGKLTVYGIYQKSNRMFKDKSMGTIVYKEDKERFIDDCNRYAKIVERVKACVLAYDIVISSDDLMKLVKGKVSAEKFLRNTWSLKYFGVPDEQNSIPLYGDIVDMYKIWKTNTGFPVLYSMTYVYNHDIFSVDEDGFPYVDPDKVKELSERLFTRVIGKGTEKTMDAIEKIAGIMSASNDKINPDVIHTYIYWDNGSWQFDRLLYARQNA